MQHQALTISRCGAYLAARILARDGSRSVGHYSDVTESTPEVRAMDPLRDPSAIAARVEALRMFESAIDEDGRQLQVHNILSIDAWRYDGGWTWNAWYKRGTITRRELGKLRTNSQLCKYMREQGYLSEESAGRIAVADDNFNIEFQDRRTGEPLFAIEYGSAH